MWWQGNASAALHQGPAKTIERVGSYGEAAAFSFYGNKNMTTAEGGIASARLLFRRAAEAGSAAAAVAIGKTNDPRFLAKIGAQGIVPDPAAAAEWYRRAAALGARDADRLLEELQASAAQ